jgi:tetratricopeptide (TPR) repeat protein
MSPRRPFGRARYMSYARHRGYLECLVPFRSRIEASVMISMRARALVVFALVFALAACGSSHSRFVSHMERGKSYLAAGNLDKAYVEFRNALQIEPRNNDAFYFNGRVAERRGNVRQAVEFYQAAIDVQPDDSRSRASLAKVFVLGGATQRALEVISPGLLDHPDDPDLLAARAAVRHELKDDGEAEVDAERAVKLAPANENAIGVLAALALRSGDNARAIALVQDAVTRAPASIDLRQILASIYLATSQPRLAEEQMRKIIALEPSELAPRMMLANHFQQARELDQAQQVLEQAVRDLPQKNAPKLALVDFITTQRSREQGEKALREFVAREPDNEDLRLGLGTLLQRTGATQQAVDTYRDIIRREGLTPKGLAARDRVAAIELSRGHEAEAKKLIAEVLQESTRDDDALIMRANIELAHDDPSNAIVDLRSVLHDQPKSVILLRSLARAYLAKGEPALAEETLRSAMDAAPAEVAVRIEFAQFLMQTDRALQAVTLLEGTVRDTPDDSQAREALVHAYIANHDLRAARAAAHDLQTLRPNYAEGYYLAGLIAHDEGRLDDSEKTLEHALELQPGSIDILSSLTRFDLERGHGAAAVARLQHTIDHDPNNVQLLDLLGGAYLETRDLPHATETLTQAIALDPRSWVSLRDLAQVRLAAGDPNGAIETYRAALQVAPTQTRVVTELAEIYERQGRIDDAIACYDAVYNLDPATQRLVANNLAVLLVTYKTDRASLERARALTADFATSDNASFLDTMGWVRFKRREYRDAVIVLERAADRSPDSKVIRYHLGMAQLRLGEREHARTNLESALSGSGNFTGSDEARSALASLKVARSTG